jgi:heme exporter protein A
MAERLSMIEVRGLVKAFGRRVALRGVDLRVEAGEFLTLLGPNGAGKTTLVRILATLSRPTAGQVFINGFDLAENAGEVRRCLGVVSHQTLLYDELTAGENLEFYSRMYDLPAPQARIAEILELVGLAQRRDDLVRTLSRGMQQRLAIARAILHDPPILLLDEPDTGLDQQAAARLRELLATVGLGGRTVLMTTHNLERGLAVGDRVAILARGRIVYQAARDALDGASFQQLYQYHVATP